MSAIEYNDLAVKADDEGYLLDIDVWNETVACAQRMASKNNKRREKSLSRPLPSSVHL